MPKIGWGGWAYLAATAAVGWQNGFAGLAMLVVGVAYLVITHVDERHTEVMRRLDER